MLEVQFLGNEVEVIIDRPKGSQHPTHQFSYKLNYGYLPDTVGGDEEEIDAYILDVDSPAKSVQGKVIGIIVRINDQENKLLVATSNKEFTLEEVRALTHFQEQYFKIEIILVD